MAQENSAVVELADGGKGGRYRPLSPNSKEEIENFLEKAGFFGIFKVVPGKQITGDDKSGKIQVYGMDEGEKSALLKVQFGGKHSRQLMCLCVPEPYNKEMKTFFEKLQDTAVAEYGKTARRKKAVIQKSAEKRSSPTKAETDQDNKGAKIMRSPKRPAAASVFKDLGILKIMLEILLPLIGEEISKDFVLAEIKKQGLECSEVGALAFLVREGFLAEKKVPHKRSIICSTEKGKMLFRKEMKKEYSIADITQFRADAVKYAGLRSQLDAVQEEGGRLEQELESARASLKQLEEKLQSVKELEQQLSAEMEPLAEAASVHRQIIDALGFGKQ